MVQADILVIGTSLDPHIEAVLSGLPQTMRVQRLDVDRFPKECSVSLDISSCPRVKVSVTVDEVSCDLDDVKIGWFRRLGKPGVANDLPPKYHTFALNESTHVIESVALLTPAKTWINSFPAARLSALKPYQYTIAGEVGLAVPPTLISNDHRLIESQWASLESGIAKTLSAPVISDHDGVREFAFTRRLNGTSPPLRSELAVAPIQLQALIEPAYEVRVTTIGKSHFGVRILSQNSLGIARDWRSQYSNITYGWIDLPDEVQSQLTALLEILDLRYAASDFIVDCDQKWWFLEANPHGAWLWLENELKESRITCEFRRYLQDLC